MLVLRLAWRSFLRHRRQSAVTTLAVALSLALMLIFIGVTEDEHSRFARIGMRLGAAQVLIQGRGYQEAQTLDFLVQQPAAVLAAARSLPGVTAAAPRLRANGLLAAGESSAQVIVSGVVPEAEPGVSDIPLARRIAGAYLRSRSRTAPGQRPADVYIGAGLARSLGLAVGDRTVLTVVAPGTARPMSASFLVCGIFRTGVAALDGAYVEIPLARGQELLRLGPAVTQVALMLDQLEDTARVVDALRGRLDGGALEVLPWEAVLVELHAVIVLHEIGIRLLLGVIFLIVGLGVLNTVLMSVMERTRELGVMMAVGTSRGQIFGTILAETLVLATVAASLGLVLGVGLHLWVSVSGINLARWFEGVELAGIVLDGHIYSRLSAAVALRSTLVVVLVTLLSSVYPALRAIRLRPAEAIRHV